MHKYIIKSIIMCLAVMGLQACTNLDEEPIGLLAPESFFKTPADAESAVMGTYSELAGEGLYGRKLILTLQLLSDMGDIGDVGTASRRIQLNDFIADSNNGMVAVIWPHFYQVIGAANSAIDGIPAISMDENYKNQLIAEARLVRALSYYHLVRLFGEIPYIGSFVTDPNEIKDISKTSVDEVYANIIADCKAGIEHLPNQYDPNVRSRPTKGAAKTLLASVYLTRGEFALAAQYAEEVINEASDYDYELLADYQDLWKADLGNHKEQVWAVDFKGGITGPSEQNSDYMAAITGVRDADMQGWSVLVPSPGVYDSFDDRDYRKKVSFLTETPVAGVMTPYTNWKWPRIHTAKWNLYPGSSANSNGTASDHNYNIFRFAEVLLIAAEAINEANGGPSAKAYEYINRVRQRARNYAGTETDFPGDFQSGMSQAEFREVVREERRVELAFEYKRWYDLKRWNTALEAFTGPNSYEPHSNFKNDFLLLPLPQPELTRNPNLLPQNPGY